MTYLIDQAGTPGTVFGNLFTIISQDLGLGTGNVPGDTTVQSVTYDKDPANTTATAQRVLDIVNDPGTVIATGLPSGTTIVLHLDLPTGDVSIDVTGNGFTFHEADEQTRLLRLAAAAVSALEQMYQTVHTDAALTRARLEAMTPHRDARVRGRPRASRATA